MPVSVLGFLLGDLLFQQLIRLPDLLIVKCVLLMLFVCLWLRTWFGLALLMGWLWAYGYALVQLKQVYLAPEFQGQEVQVEGLICSLPVVDERKTRFDFQLTANPLVLPAKIRVSWYSPEVSLGVGQHWVFKIKLKAVHGLANPGGFDYEQWMFTQGIGATAYVRDPQQAKLIKQDSFWQNFSVIRQLIAERLSVVPHLRYRGFLEALTIGKTDGVSNQQWRILRKTGTLHLMAISGSHISLIAGLSYFLVLHVCLRMLPERVSPQWIAAIGAGLTGWSYALLAGFSIPVQRALVMLVVALLGVILQRHIRITGLIAIAILLMLVLDPLAVLSAGFWLSCIAVILIWYVVSGRLAKERHWLSFIKVNSVTALGLAPLMILFFLQFSLIAPVANLIAVPVVNLLIVPPALVAVLLLFCAPSLAIWLFSWLDVILDKLYQFLQWLAGWDYANLAGLSTSGPAILLAAIGFLVLFMPRGLPGRSLSALLCLPLFLNAPARPESGTLKMTLLDIGQGLSAVIQTAEHVLVFDVGIKFSAQADSGQSVLLPFLASQGIHHIDTLIISHGDNDHIGGAASLLAEFKPTRIYTSVPERLSAFAVLPCYQGLNWQIDGVIFQILAPAVNDDNVGNEHSCVLKVSSASGALLLPGDIGKATEQWLVDNYGDALSASVLVSPHHGSNTSSSQDFLVRVNPKMVLIPAGYQNQFNFPHSSVLERYQLNHLSWLNVSEQGAITVEFSSNNLKFSYFRAINQKYWHKVDSSAKF